MLALPPLAALLGCAVHSDTGATACAAARPQVCTMEYMPVCGQLIEGGERDYSSACNACADDAVASYAPGACEKEQ
jgi:hypothetical protein